MTEGDWGEIDSLPAPKSGLPRWMWFCGCSCLAMLLAVLALGIGTYNWWNKGLDKELQWSRLEQALPFDNHPEDYALTWGNHVPFLDVDVWVFIEKGEDGDEFGEHFVMLLHILSTDESTEVLVGGEALDEGEEITLRIQGRDLTATRLRNSNAASPFPGAPKAEPGATLLVDVTPEGDEQTLLLVMVRQGSEEEISEESVAKFLEPFHVGPDR